MDSQSKLSYKAMVIIAAGVLAVALLYYQQQGKPNNIVLAARSTTGPSQVFLYDNYSSVLKGYVDHDGMVNYHKLKVDRKGLDAFALAIGSLDRQKFEKWKDQDKIAFWINAYNGLTLKAIVDHYPIKASFFRSLTYPKNSIRQISGVWDKLTFSVLGRNMTLNQIEHEVLRKKFNEPRIHMALVCAAMGCPALRAKPYTGSKLNAQLDDQARRFLKKPDKFRIDRNAGRIYLSSIFKWFGQDFEKKYPTDRQFKDRDKALQAVLNFISKYLDKKDRDYLLAGKYKVKYTEYDWKLNEKPKK